MGIRGSKTVVGKGHGRIVGERAQIARTHIGKNHTDLPPLWRHRRARLPPETPEGYARTNRESVDINSKSFFKPVQFATRDEILQGMNAAYLAGAQDELLSLLAVALAQGVLARKE